MNDEPRQRIVSVAVIYDPNQGFLLWHNKRWGGYAFPMKHVEPAQDPADVALNSLSDTPIQLQGAAARPTEYVGWCGWSPTARETGYYDYHVFEIAGGGPTAATTADPDVRYFPYAELIEATNVTESTKFIARSLVEFQDVAVGVIAREGAGGKEFLLIYNSNYQYFFPAARLKTDAKPEVVAVDAVRLDTGYQGQMRATRWGDTPDVHSSHRFGPRDRLYAFQVCTVHLAGVDLNQPDNLLEMSLNALQTTKQNAGQRLGSRGYWGWFSEDELRTFTEMSPTMEAVLLSALQAVGS